MERLFYKEHYEALKLCLSNKYINDKDLSFASSLYNQKTWSIKQAHAVHTLLNKCQNKLEKTIPKIEDVKAVDPIWSAILTDKTVRLSFSSNDQNIFFKTMDTIKEIAGRSWDQELKLWGIPLTLHNVKTIQKMGFEFDTELAAWYKDKIDPVKEAKRKEQVDPIKLATQIDLNDVMYPFQKDGLSYIEQKDGRTLVGDEPGLGKTLQALSYLKLHPEITPVIIVVPASLKINWQREIKKWINQESYIVNGRKPTNDYAEEKLIIINYSIIEDHVAALKKLKPKCIIGDEIHAIKNNKAKRTKAFKLLCKNVPHVLGLSGTAILNRPIEIFNIANILQPEIFPSYYRFGQRYCNPVNNGFGTVYQGVTHSDELYSLLTEHVMVRRKKEEHLTELPDKQQTSILLELDTKQRALYNKAEQDIIRFIQEQKGMEAAQRASRAETLAKFNQLKQITAEGKTKETINWIENFLESDQKLVVFAVHKKMIASLYDKFKDVAVKIDGSCSSKQRQEAVDSFQNNPDTRLFIGNIQAASEGITLTAASNVAIIEYPWTPGALIQATDRIHRIGQKEACMVHYIVAVNTIEEDIIEALDRKTKIITAVLDGKEAPDEDLLTTLIKKYDK